jgi:hypothetical protein
LALTAAISALATAGLTISTIRLALAEFEIEESTVEKGEVELEYRGAVHWGFPKTEREAAEEGGEGGALEKRKRKRRSGKATISNFIGVLPTGGCFRLLSSPISRSGKTTA